MTADDMISQRTSFIWLLMSTLNVTMTGFVTLFFSFMSWLLRILLVKMHCLNCKNTHFNHFFVLNLSQKV